MCGFYKGSGKVLIDGIEVKAENIKKIRAITGSVLQDPDEQLFMPTLFDDVAFGPLNLGFDETEIKRRVEEALQTVGLARDGASAAASSFRRSETRGGDRDGAVDVAKDNHDG